MNHRDRTTLIVGFGTIAIAAILMASVSVSFGACVFAGTALATSIRLWKDK